MHTSARILSIWLILGTVTTGYADELYLVDEMDPQPLLAQVARLEEALDFLGASLSAGDKARLATLRAQEHTADTVKAVQEILDPYCLAMVSINPEARVKARQGPAKADLAQNGWTSFLVKVHNEAHVRAPLNITSPNAEPLLHASKGGPYPAEETKLTPGEVANRFLEVALYQVKPLRKELSGLPLEYVILQIYTKAAGFREAKLAFDTGHGKGDLGFRNELDILLNCRPATKVVLRVRDYDGSPTMAGFVFTDGIPRTVADPETDPFPKDYRERKAAQREWESAKHQVKRLAGVYPAPSRRLAETDEFPDFYFHPQVYRADGEHVYLPAGNYHVTYTRGPEYLPQETEITVPADVDSMEVTFNLERWIHMAKLGWYSADHHVHAGGCSHYESPQAGVRPEHMFRQALGEDLNISCVLTWGPCWYYQKTFFEGKTSALSQPGYLMRYDVEVSGFPSSHAGHLCLLRLKEDDYPGTTLIEEWPSWTLPVLRWGKEQGGVVGYSHSGWGLEPLEKGITDLPNYVMAKFDGIGANEYIVTVVHGVCDFISAGDTPWPWEMNIWYHTLNSGFRAAISGETDFPCIFDERIGMARSYAYSPEALDFDHFMDKVRQGANYVSDGKSHLIDFDANGIVLGKTGNELKLDAPAKVTVKAKAAAYLTPEQGEVGAAIAAAGPTGRPYWDVEKARIGKSRKVPVELVVNGYPVAKTEIEADGELRDVAFETEIKHSSWAALRIPQSSHTNPIFIEVAGKPTRASRRSAEWCRAAVDKCWEQKSPRFRPEELEAARNAYDVARAAYDKAIAEAVAE